MTSPLAVGSHSGVSEQNGELRMNPRDSYKRREAAGDGL